MSAQGKDQAAGTDRSDSGKDRGAGQPDTSAAGGEDESSTEKEGDDSHLHDDQKAPTLKTDS
jgi:hypothetical protein